MSATVTPLDLLKCVLKLVHRVQEKECHLKINIGQ